MFLLQVVYLYVTQMVVLKKIGLVGILLFMINLEIIESVVPRKDKTMGKVVFKTKKDEIIKVREAE